MMFTVSQGIKEFCANMVANPQDWKQERYEFINVKHPDLAIWTCNGVFFIYINGADILSLAEKIAVSRAVKLTLARKLKAQP